MVHLKSPVSIENTLALFAQSIGCLQRTAKNQNIMPRSKHRGIVEGCMTMKNYWGSITGDDMNDLACSISV